ncbi:MAG: hypothetical protein KDB61_01390 [Planctomycetes bacterium]|nr:hypothetical protein [Planctomycetota bacterium]
MSDWLEAARDLPVVDVAVRLGLEVRGGRSLAPCPSCGADVRSRTHHDHRGPIGVTPNGRGWRCHKCDAHGDAIQLARECLGVEALPAFFGGSGNLKPWNPPIPKPKAPDTPELLRPPGDEVADLWVRCLPVTDDADVRAWASGRGWDLATLAHVADRDLARALPPDGLPPWARFGRRTPWSVSGHRLIVPLWGATGDLVSVRARYCLPGGTPRAKALGPFRDRPDTEPGYSVRGLAMGDAVTVAMLRTGQPPEWWEGKPFELWIAEGEPDFLRLATWWGDAGDHAPAVLGIIAGSIDAPLMARVPTGAVVTLATDDDRAGDKYAVAAWKELAVRCTVKRSKG